MTPATLDLTLYRGTTFAIQFVCKTVSLTVVNLTGWNAYAMVRTNPQRHLVLDLAPVITAPTAGEIQISLTDEETAAIESPGEFVWDLVLERPSGEKLGPFLTGAFTITTTNARD